MTRFDYEKAKWKRTRSPAAEQADAIFEAARRKPTRRQRALIADLCRELGVKPPRVPNRQAASAEIDRLLAMKRRRT